MSVSKRHLSTCSRRRPRGVFAVPSLGRPALGARACGSSALYWPFLVMQLFSSGIRPNYRNAYRVLTLPSLFLD